MVYCTENKHWKKNSSVRIAIRSPKDCYMTENMFTKTLADGERKFLIDCIRFYRELPSLWNMKSKEYHDRKKKSIAYDMLVNKFRERYPNATKEDVKRKINSLRTCYRKELRKHLHSLKTGDDVYEPTLYYYNEMRFLEEQESTSESSSMDLECRNISMDIEENDKYECSTSAVNITQGSPLFSNQKKKAVKLQKLEQLMDLACQHLKDKSDDYKHWAMACAADLKKMEPTQQIFAKKAIAEILMEGQLGLLHRNSVKINETSENVLHETIYEDQVAVKYSSTPSPSYIDES
ncbi:unnamed protein product [Colias eurytheme]|nr:unnamed protein product [Colias eurytheme]